MKLVSFIGRLMVAVVILLALYALGWSFSHIGTVIRAMAVACLAAYLVNPIVKRLQSRGLSRDMAIAAVFLAFFTALTVTFYLLVPIAQRQIVQIGVQLQDFASQSDEHISRLQVILEKELPVSFMKDQDLEIWLGDGLEKLSSGAISLATSLLLGVASNLIYVFLFPLIIFLLLRDAPHFYYQIINIMPNRYFEVIHRLINGVDDQLGGYMRGVMVVAFCVGVVTTVGLWICGLNYFFVIGPLMGLLNIIPIFGPIIGMVIAALAIVFQTGELGSIIGPILVGITAQMLDNVAFTPIAVSRSVDLHPLLVLLMTLIGGELFGLVGLLLAVPATATVKVIWQAIQEARQSTASSLTLSPQVESNQ